MIGSQLAWAHEWQEIGHDGFSSYSPLSSSVSKLEIHFGGFGG